MHEIFWGISGALMSRLMAAATEVLLHSTRRFLASQGALKMLLLPFELDPPQYMKKIITKKKIQKINYGPKHFIEVSNGTEENASELQCLCSFQGYPTCLLFVKCHMSCISCHFQIVTFLCQKENYRQSVSDKVTY